MSMERFLDTAMLAPWWQRGRVTVGVSLGIWSVYGSMLMYRELRFEKMNGVQDQAPSADDALASSPEKGGCPAAGMTNERMGRSFERRVCTGEWYIAISMSVCERLLLITLDTYLCITDLGKQIVLLCSRVQELEALKIVTRGMLLANATTTLIGTRIKRRHPRCR